MSYGTSADQSYRWAEKQFVAAMARKIDKGADGEPYLTTASCILANIIIIRGKYGRDVVWGKGKPKLDTSSLFVPLDGRALGLWTELVAEVRMFAIGGDAQVVWILGKIGDVLKTNIDAAADGPRQSQAHNRT